MGIKQFFKRAPRGLRDFNPGNIRHNPTIQWKGRSPVQTDPEFVQFLTPEYGIRAICRILRKYKSDGLNTIGAAITRWAPPKENNTPAYIKDVCAGCNRTSNEVVDFDAIMAVMIKSIILHENGIEPYTDDQINQGIALA